MRKNGLFVPRFSTSSVPFSSPCLSTSSSRAKGEPEVNGTAVSPNKRLRLEKTQADSSEESDSAGIQNNVEGETLTEKSRPAGVLSKKTRGRPIRISRPLPPRAIKPKSDKDILRDLDCLCTTPPLQHSPLPRSRLEPFQDDILCKETRAAMAVENKRKMPELMARLSDGAVYRTQLCAAPPKVPRKAREYPKIKVTVEKASALDAALEMANRQSEHDSAKDMARRRRIAILSVASQNTYTYNKILGGHWDEGSVATEEEDLCLRTTLPMSFCGLPKGSRGDDYSGFRLSRQEALYTRDVWVVRAG